MANNQNAEIETDYYSFLNRVLAAPGLLQSNSGEFQSILNKLLLLNDMERLNEIRRRTYSLLNLSPPPFKNSFIAVQEIKRIIPVISRNSQPARMNAAKEISNETNVTRVRTADKQTKAVTDFIKG